jgi:hypothetical protein
VISPDEEQPPRRGDTLAAEVVESTGVDVVQSGQRTAKKAVALLVEHHGFTAPTKMIRRHVAMAFAARGKVVYGNAFDVVRVTDGTNVEWAELSSVEANLAEITLYEVKSTKLDLPPDFAGYFFDSGAVGCAEPRPPVSLRVRQHRQRRDIRHRSRRALPANEGHLSVVEHPHLMS